MEMKGEKYRMLKSKRTFSWTNKKLELGDTEFCGKGVFTKENVKKDELLAVFGGYILTRLEEEKLFNILGDEGMQISKDLVMVNKKKSETELASFFNHSCSPNAGFKGQIFLVAMKDIKSGEQIVFDYGMVLHRSKKAKIYKMKCSCGEPCCRNVITENDWKIKQLQTKYFGYFQFYLQDKIEKQLKK